MYCGDTYQYKLIWLSWSDLTGPMWMKHRRVGCEIVAEELPAMRGYHRVEEAKTEGCMADGLRCNIWARAQTPKSLTYSLMKGGHFPGLRRGACSLQLTDIVWKPGMQLARPHWRVEHPTWITWEPSWFTFLWVITMTGFNQFSCLHQTEIGRAHV